MASDLNPEMKARYMAIWEHEYGGEPEEAREYREMLEQYVDNLTREVKRLQEKCSTDSILKKYMDSGL